MPPVNRILDVRAAFAILALFTLVACFVCLGCSSREASSTLSPPVGKGKGSPGSSGTGQALTPGGAAPEVTDPLVLLRFPRAGPDGKDLLPEGWEPYQFKKVPRQTIYDVVIENGAPALRARSESAASAVRRRVGIDPSRYPCIEWEWKIDHPIEGANCLSKEGDDCAARLMILYRYDPASASFPERVKFNAAKSLEGEYPPSAMLVYAWTEEEDRGQILTSPYSDRVKLIPLERGAMRAGAWVTERRNHFEDFELAFGRVPPEIEWVAFLVDTDDTKSKDTAWLKALRFLPPAPR